MDLFSSLLTKEGYTTPLATTGGANTLSQSPLRHLLRDYIVNTGPVQNSKQGNYFSEELDPDFPCGDRDCEMCYDEDGNELER